MRIHLFSILNTKQTNDGIFSNKAMENFDLAKIVLNARIRLLWNLILTKKQLLLNVKLLYDQYSFYFLLISNIILAFNIYEKSKGSFRYSQIKSQKQSKAWIKKGSVRQEFITSVLHQENILDYTEVYPYLDPIFFVNFSSGKS